jgi:hypothetical protein
MTALLQHNYAEQVITIIRLAITELFPLVHEKHSVKKIFTDSARRFVCSRNVWIQLQQAFPLQ